jgi:uncharacterized protein with HEPN domain
MPHDDLALVESILVEVRDAREFTRGLNRKKFIADRMRRKSVAYSIQTIGEIARRLSPEFKAAHPEVPWTDIVAMRNVIVHEYDAVNYFTVWSVVQRRLPELETVLTSLAADDQ